MAERVNISTLEPIKSCIHRDTGLRYYILGTVKNQSTSREMVHYVKHNSLDALVLDKELFYQQFHSVRNINLHRDHDGFAHTHPRLQAKLGVDSEHVIIDRRDWAIIRNKLIKD